MAAIDQFTCGLKKCAFVKIKKWYPGSDESENDEA
jgi:hypothetical protein